MVEDLPPGALESEAARSDEYEIPTDECCFTGCCERGKAFLLEQLDAEHLDAGQLDKGAA